MNNRYTNRRLAFLILFCLPFIFTHAQTKSSIENKVLYAEIAHMDSALFNAFNTRDIDKLKTFFSKELEVYQDNTGLRNYTQTVESFTELFKKEYVLKRELIKQSMEVYPVKDFGAIQTGQHTFCHTENGKLECGTFKFVHIWEKKDGSWKIKRLITYDH
jgi:hypothetical protein